MPSIDKTELMNTIRGILVGQVGFYEFPGSPNLQPAIAFLPDDTYKYEYPPPTVTVTGVECVVLSPTTSATPRSDRTTQYSDRWQIFLKQWDLSVDVVKTAETLTFGLAQTEYSFTNWNETGASEELGLLRTISLSIRDDFVQADL